METMNGNADINITKLFKKLNQKINTESPTTTATPEESCDKIPYKESSTLNQILYVNERHNKRLLPKNDDKKNLYEILDSGTMKKTVFDDHVDAELNDLKKDWKHVSLLQKRNLVRKYCLENEVTLTDTVFRSILNNHKYVTYSPEESEIKDISMPLY